MKSQCPISWAVLAHLALFLLGRPAPTHSGGRPPAAAGGCRCPSRIAGGRCVGAHPRDHAGGLGPGVLVCIASQVSSSICSCKGRLRKQHCIIRTLIPAFALSTRGRSALASCASRRACRTGTLPSGKCSLHVLGCKQVQQLPPLLQGALAGLHVIRTVLPACAQWQTSSSAAS